MPMAQPARTSTASLLLALTLACAPEEGDGGPGPGATPTPTGPVSPTLTVVLDKNLTSPRDLAFNPRKPDQLWVVNRDGTVAIVDGATDPQTLKVEVRRDRDYLHFMPNPAALAFGADETNPNTPNPALAPGTFATCQESRNGGLDPKARGNDFMGPVLWSSDRSVFALKNGMLGSHLDMLHQSPLCMGITWVGTGNQYFVYNGSARSIDRYDFQQDHGFGNDNHDDGIIQRYAAGKMSYVEGVPSHLVYAPDEQAVYVADSGNGRLVRLSFEAAKAGAPLVPKQDERESYTMSGETLTEIVPASAMLVTRPSGIELFKGDLFVSDHEAGDIVRLSRTGTLVARYQLGAGAGRLAGMAFGPDGRLYFVDMLEKRVIRIETAF
jgi:hypothetical protein